MSEVELKLAGCPKSGAKMLAMLGLQRALKVNHAYRYMDTPERDLSNCGWTLTLHREDGQWTQTLQARRACTKHRLEDTVPVSVRGNQGVPLADLGRHQSRPARVLLNKMLKSRPSQRWPSMVEHGLVRFSRRRCELVLGSDHGTITLDVGRIQANGERWPLSVVTMGFTSGGARQTMFALAQKMVQEHGMCLSTESLHAHGQALAFPNAPPCFATAGELAYGAAASSDQQLRAMVANCLDQVLPNASEVAFGQGHAEQIHQLRVGLRRLRTLLKEASAWADDMDPSWQAPLTTAFRQLGAHRDQVLMDTVMRSRLREAGAPEGATWPCADQATDTPRDIVRASDFQSALLKLLAFSVGQTSKPPGKADVSRTLLEKRIRKLHREVVADGDCFTSLSEDQQHRVRKRLKRLRYLTEFAKPLFESRRVERYLDVLRPAQDALGALHDNATALRLLRKHPPADAGAWFAVGWLTASQNHAAQACRKALRRIAKGELFWR